MKTAITSGLIAFALLVPATSRAQGKCIRAYGTPACNTDPIPRPFAPTGWRTTALEHITFRVADPQKEAAFYGALMGWTVRSSDASHVVMDIGQWGTVVFNAAPASAFAGEVHAVVDGVGFVIEPWDARAVEAALRQRGLTPVADDTAGGFQSFHIKDPDGFDVQVSNGGGHDRARHTAQARPTTTAPFAATGWHTVWLDHFSFNAKDYKASAAFYQALFGWQPTYDEGSQNELMMADVGDIIVRGGNRLAPGFNPRGPSPATRIDHISWGIDPWDTDRVKGELDKRGLKPTIDTSDGNEIHVAQFKSYHVRTPNGYNLQISYNTHDTRLNLAISVNPRRPGIH
jgi:catechol 2,3-dioxygenase-like lactoylglutathione lyase family enzyme